MLQGAAGRGLPRDGTAGTSGGGGGGGGRDRISDLPDELRHHIFSFMPAWEVVRTSTLSRRWRHIWASTPCLDIRYLCGCHADADQDYWFAEFVKNLLLKRRKSAPLDTLRLRWNHDDANTWIAHAVRRNARAIELSGEHHLPKLEPEYWIFLYGNLKILQLSHLHMNDNTLSQLCSRCTSLEELELKNVDIYAMSIRSTSLKRLTMVRCVNHNGLSVDAPNLVLLRCVRPHGIVPGIENSGSLLTVTIMLADSCLQCYHAPCPHCADAEDPGHSESQSASDDNRSAGSGAEDLGNNESHSEPDNDSSADSGAEDLGNNESQSELDNESSAGSDAVKQDDNGDDGEIADVYSGDDDDNSAGSDAEGPDNSDDEDEDDDDDDNEIADVYSSEDDCYDSPIIYGGHGILRSISSVITMNLSAHQGELVLRKELQKNCPEFKNLRTLSIGEWCIDPGFESLSTMLEKSPNLENLFIHLDKAYDSTDNIHRSFTCNNLKVKIVEDGMMAPLLEEFSRTNYCSREKRKAQGEAAKSPAKERKV